MPLILGTNSIKDTGFNVANSLRFDRGSSSYLNRTPSSAGDTKKASFSCWFKISELAATRSSAYQIFHSVYDGLNRWLISIDDSDRLFVGHYNGSGWDLLLISSQKIRDMSAFYNLIVIIDTSQSTSSNRVKIYLNGSQVTDFGTETYPSQNFDGIWCKNSTTEIGRYAVSSTQYGSFYLAESVCLDGTVASTTDFGEFDEDSPTIWKPKDVSGLTFGTNGFYLDFEDSSSLGNDSAGSNNFTVNNLTATDQSTDTCTNNFCTWNPLDNYYPAMTFSDGNLRALTTINKYTYNSTTIGMTSGKYYCEIKCTAQSAHSSGSPQDAMVLGITSTHSGGTTQELGHNAHDWGMYANGDGTNGQYRNNDSLTNYGVTFTTGDIIGIYVDLDNNKLYFAKNGTIMQSGTGISITAPASTPRGAYFFAVNNWSSTTSGTFDANFGGTQSFTVSSGNTDPNGYGNFEYDPSAGTFDGASKNFYALNTKNLAEFG
tara:strand:- start:401 stop:1861 length:1461 start_codon:yes stop_codon:yes gene_type:complete